MGLAVKRVMPLMTSIYTVSLSSCKFVQRSQSGKRGGRGSDINVISFLMGVTPVDELGLIEQMCSLSSYSGVDGGREKTWDRREKSETRLTSLLVHGPFRTSLFSTVSHSRTFSTVA